MSICIVTSTNIANNPRLVKEADALSEAGYDVRVVAVAGAAERLAFDETVVKASRWRVTVVDATRRDVASYRRWIVASLRQDLCKRGRRFFDNERLVALAYDRFVVEVANAAASEPADLYIGHLGALAAASWAARRHGAKLGFDAEDFHRGEFRDEAANRPAIALTAAAEERYIPRCDYVTAASDGIATAYQSVLGISRPTTILNCVPLAERHGTTPSEELARERRGPGLSLYWYSQTIGPDRGLKDALHAMSLLGEGVQLHLRGTWVAGYEAEFLAHARRLGVRDRVHHLAPAPPRELAERASQHDVGLALEPGDRINNDLAVSNKILNYLVAGLAIAATDTTGQRGIMTQAAGAGFVFSPGSAETLADGLRSWLNSKQALAACRTASCRAAEQRFCWEHEKRSLLRVVQECISLDATNHSRSIEKPRLIRSNFSEGVTRTRAGGGSK